MSFLGDAFNFLLGGESKPADWDQIERLMAMSADLNRFDQNGMFTSTNWTESPDGRWSQSQTVNESLMPAFESFMGRLNSAPNTYAAPQQMSSLLDAKMANQMQRHGVLDPQFQLPETMFGPGSAEQTDMRQQEQAAAQEQARAQAEEAIAIQEQENQQRQQNDPRFFRQQNTGGGTPIGGSPRRMY